MANFAATDKNLPDTLDYLLSGYNSLGNEFQGKSAQAFAYVVYGEPYMRPVDEGFPPPPDFYIRTDMFLPITITDPRQSVAVGMNIRPFIGYDVLGGPGFGSIDIYLSLNRYPASQRDNSILPPVVVKEKLIIFSSDISNPVNGDPITTGTSGLVFPPAIDTPGTPGDYVYWLEFYFTASSFYPDPTLDVLWLGADDRGISASMVKP